MYIYYQNRFEVKSSQVLTFQKRWVICCQVCDVINFEIKLTFLIKQFSDMTKKSGKKFKYLKNEKSFFKPESEPLIK